LQQHDWNNDKDNKHNRYCRGEWPVAVNEEFVEQNSANKQ